MINWIRCNRRSFATSALNVAIVPPGKSWRRNHCSWKILRPTREQIAEWLAGNICRCGAYGAIAQSILEAAEEYRSEKVTKEFIG